MKVDFLRRRYAVGVAIGLWLVSALAGVVVAEGPAAVSGRVVFKRYNLSCLAPLLENLNKEEPKSLDEAFLLGPTGLLNESFVDCASVGGEAVSFPITTTSEAAQSHFNRGVALLHTMWYLEAERSFRRVIQSDPECAMGYWGLALSNELHPGRAKLFARIAVNKTSLNRPQLEQKWIDILADYYEVRTPDQSRPGGAAPEQVTSVTLVERSADRVRALEDLVIEFPQEIEAKAFLLRQLTLDEYRIGARLRSHLGVDRLAKDLAVMAPRHPSRHYGVFLWLDRRPDLGVSYAEQAPKNSPAVAEVWRYAGEVHAASGRMMEAVRYYEAAVRVDHRFLEEQLLMPWETQNLAMNYKALIEALSGMGRIEEALAWSRRALRFPSVALASVDGVSSDLPSLGRKQSLVILASAEDWPGVLEEVEQQSKGGFGEQAEALFWKGVAELFLNRGEESEATADALKALMTTAIKAGVSNQTEKKISLASKSLAVCQRFVMSEKAVPMELEDGHSLLTPMLLIHLHEKVGLGQHAAALARARVADRPHEVLSVATYADLAFRTGNKRDAFFHLNRRLRSNASSSDVNLAVLRRLDAVAAEMQLPIPWVLRAKSELGIAFPDDMNELGPIEWTPPLAPGFLLADCDDQEWGGRDFDGKPILLNFFLGVTCPFCVEQLNTFRPHLPAFEKAGIEFVAVSTDPVSILQQRFGASDGRRRSQGEDFPFLVLADSSLEAFRSFGAFDGFEDGPLHATILLDGKGRVLWADRGHAPFDRPEALLSESVRLLSLFGGE